MDLHRFDEAAQEFQIVHGLMPGAPEPYNGIGNALLLQGKLERAMKQYQEALSIRPDFPGARQTLEKALAVKQSQPQL